MWFVMTPGRIVFTIVKTDVVACSKHFACSIWSSANKVTNTLSHFKLGLRGVWKLNVNLLCSANTLQL